MVFVDLLITVQKHLKYIKHKINNAHYGLKYLCPIMYF